MAFITWKSACLTCPRFWIWCLKATFTACITSRIYLLSLTLVACFAKNGKNRYQENWNCPIGRLLATDDWEAIFVALSLYRTFHMRFCRIHLNNYSIWQASTPFSWLERPFPPEALSKCCRQLASKTRYLPHHFCCCSVQWPSRWMARSPQGHWKQPYYVGAGQSTDAKTSPWRQTTCFGPLEPQDGLPLGEPILSPYLSSHKSIVHWFGLYV